MVNKFVYVTVLSALVSLPALADKPPILGDPAPVIVTNPVSVESMPSIHIQSIPEIMVTPTETAEGVTLYGRFIFGTREMMDMAEFLSFPRFYYISTGEKFILRHIACTALIAGGDTFSLWLEDGSDEFLLPIVGFSQNVAAGDISLHAQYVNSQVVNDVTIGAGSIVLKGRHTKIDGLDSTAECHLYGAIAAD